MSSHLRLSLPGGLFLQIYHTQICICHLFHACCMSHTVHPLRSSRLLGPNILLTSLFPNTLNLSCFLGQVTSSHPSKLLIYSFVYIRFRCFDRRHKLNDSRCSPIWNFLNFFVNVILICSYLSLIFELCRYVASSHFTFHWTTFKFVQTCLYFWAVIYLPILINTRNDSAV